jgi:predicted metalloprotease with PDZ domain
VISSPFGLRLARAFPASLFLLAFFSASSYGTISYQLSLAHPEQHLFHVTMTIPDVKGEVTVQMPAWNALYQIRDFSDRVQRVEAFAGNPSDDASRLSTLDAEKIDKQTWRIKADGTVTIRYATYWDDAGPFASQLNREHAFINSAMLLPYVPERRGESVNLVLANVPNEWNVATSAPLVNSELGRGRVLTIQVPNFDALADSPIEIGKFQQFDLPGLSPAVSIAVHGEGWSKKQIEEDLTKICKYELKLMGGAPYEHYTFILHIGRGYGGGGMEHATSTAIGVQSPEFLNAVAAHEFFHLWNVKRIRPASLEPVDYTKEQYTRALWFAEGVTSTYGSYTMLRSHLWSKEQFYGDLAAQITELESRPANQWQSAEQSSLDAWLEKYPLYNRPEYSVSYYTKGQVLGVLLDLQIRERTNGVKSFDDVLRLMNEEFAKVGKFYRDTLDIRLAAENVAGGSFEEFFDRYIAHANPFPYRETLAVAGLELRKTEQRRATLGFAAERAPEGGLIVREIEANSSAAEAGLKAGDLIVQWNKQDPPRRPDRWLREQKVGDALRLTLRRGEKQTELEFHLGEALELSYQIAEDTHVNDKARRIREAWLRGD